MNKSKLSVINLIFAMFLFAIFSYSCETKETEPKDLKSYKDTEKQDTETLVLSFATEDELLKYVVDEEKRYALAKSKNLW